MSTTTIYETPKSDLANEGGPAIPLSKAEILFSFQGRIGRFEYWMVSLGIFATFMAAIFIASALDVSDAALGLLFIALYVPVIWVSLAVQAKRWHDRDKSAWWILISLIPIVGPIWVFIENGCLSGTDGPNRFGLRTNSR